MKQLTHILEGIGSTVQLLVRSASYVGTLPRQRVRFIEQCFMIGYTTLPIVAILSFFIGSVLALQAGYSMQNFGAKQFIGTLVGLSMARELGPVMVAILLAGRVGSAIAAELASMKVYQEIDALETMNIPPARMLVLPRLAAVLFMMPVLTIIANLVGWFGGAIVAKYVSFIGIDPPAYFSAMRRFMDFKDVMNGLVKAEVFGFVIVLVCCNIGLNTRGGPREIGAAVTRAVVTSLILILVLDYFVTKALL
jgi:phospholipid/cholesterol/gamma-HCH transport system permease protein